MTKRTACVHRQASAKPERSTSFVHESKQEDAARVPRKSSFLKRHQSVWHASGASGVPGQFKSVRSVHIPSDVQLIDPDEVALAEEPANSAMTFRHELGIISITETICYCATRQRCSRWIVFRGRTANTIYAASILMISMKRR